MVSQDINFIISRLEKRVEHLEDIITCFEKRKSLNEQDWDNSTLLKEWHISKRTAATYRKQGLEFYKRGGRIIYTPEYRANFLKLKKSNVFTTNNNTD